MPRFPAGRRTEFADGTPAIEVPMVAVPLPEKPARAKVVSTTNERSTIAPATVWRGDVAPWRPVEDPEPDQLTITVPASHGLTAVPPPPVKRDWWDGYLADMARRTEEFYARIEREWGITRSDRHQPPEED